MGISMITNFDMRTNLPIDTRMVADTITDRNNISELVRFIGLECFVKTGENAGPYKLVGGISNDNWTLIPYDKDVMHNNGGTFTGTVKYENINGNSIIIDGNNIAIIAKDGNQVIIQDGDISLNKNGKNISSITEYIDNVVIRTNALRYKGEIIPKSPSPGTSTPKASVGDLYVSTSAGYINGVQVESGDWIICNEIAEAGEAKWDYIQANLSIMEGATSSVAGVSGTVPTPKAGDQGKYLKGDGKWTQLTIADVQNLQDTLNKKANLSGATFTGEVNVIDPTADGNAVNKKYVDDLTKSDKDAILKNIKELIGAENSVELESLLISIKNDYDDINTVVAALNLLYNIIGNLDTLSVDDNYKTNIVTAINNLHERIKTNTTNIGDINSAKLPDEYEPESITIINLLNHISELIGNWDIIETDYGEGTDSLSEVLHDIKSDLDLIAENIDELDKNKANLSGATFTGAVNVIAPTADGNAVNKKYVDDKDNEIKNLIKTVNNTVSNIKNPIIYRDIPIDDTTNKYDVDLIRDEGWYKVISPSTTNGLPPRIANEYFTILALPLHSSNSIMLMIFSDDTSSVNASGSSISRTHKALGYKFINGGIATDWTRLVGIEWVIGNAQPNENSESGFLIYSNGRLVGSGYDNNSFIKTPTDADNTQLLTYDNINKRIYNSGVEIDNLLSTNVYRGYHEYSISDGLVFYIDSTNLDGNGTTSAIDSNGDLINLVDDYSLTKYGSRNINENGFCNFGGDSSWISSDPVTADGRKLTDIVFNNTSEFTIEFVYIFNDIVSSDSTDATLFKIGEGISFEKKGWYSRLLVNNYRRASGVYYKNSRTTTYNNHPTNSSFINKAMHIVITGSNVDMEYTAYVNGVEVNGGFSALATSIPEGYEGYLYGYYEDSNLLTINETYGSVKYLKIYDTILDEDEVAGKYIQEILPTLSKTFIEDKYKPALLNHLNTDMRDQVMSASLTDNTLYLDRRVEMIPNLKFRIKCNSTIYLSDLSEGLKISTTTNNGLETSYPVSWTDMGSIPIEDFGYNNTDIPIFLPYATLDLEYDGSSVTIKNSYSPTADYAFYSRYAENAETANGIVYGHCDTASTTMIKVINIDRGVISEPKVGDKIIINFANGIRLSPSDKRSILQMSINNILYDVYDGGHDPIYYEGQKNYGIGNEYEIILLGEENILELVFSLNSTDELCLMPININTLNNYVNSCIDNLNELPFTTCGRGSADYSINNLLTALSYNTTLFLTTGKAVNNYSLNNITISKRSQVIDGNKCALVKVDSSQFKIIDSDITFKNMDIELSGPYNENGYIYIENSKVIFENCNIYVKNITGIDSNNYGVPVVVSGSAICGKNSDLTFFNCDINVELVYTNSQCFGFVGNLTYDGSFPANIDRLLFDKCKIYLYNTNGTDLLIGNTESDLYFIHYHKGTITNSFIDLVGSTLSNSNGYTAKYYTTLIKEGVGTVDNCTIKCNLWADLGRKNGYMYYAGTERAILSNNKILVSGETYINGYSHVLNNTFHLLDQNLGSTDGAIINFMNKMPTIIDKNIFIPGTIVTTENNVTTYPECAYNVNIEDTYCPFIIKNNILYGTTCQIVKSNSATIMTDNIISYEQVY